MSFVRSSHVLAAFAVTVSLGLSGCTNDAAEPSPLASPTDSGASSPSQSASVADAAPSMPAEARGTSAAAAEAFVRHWVEVLNYSGPAGNSRQLRRISSSECVDCDAIADFIDTVSRDGGRITGRGWTFLTTKSVTKTSPHATTVRAAVRVNPQTVVIKRGAKPQRFKGGERVKTFHLVSSTGVWKLVQLDQGVA